MGSSAAVLIVSEADDLHARAVQQEIRSRGFECFLIAADETAGAESFNLHFDDAGRRAILVRTCCGTLVSPSEFGVTWWRRYRPLQKAATDAIEDDHASLIFNDCVASLRGAFEVSFRGNWVSNPTATDRASNKIVQLQAAIEAGFRIPATLITQSPSALRKFCAAYGSVIYKPVAGTPGPLLFTRFVTDELLSLEDSIASCPTIYQQYVPGDLHIRLNCFGDRCFAALIESQDLDWRPNLNVPIRRYAVPESLDRLVRQTCRMLGLAMGIFDIKLTPDGEFVFLEVNPQGQFLFLEAATGEPLTCHMADYLTSEAQATKETRARGSALEGRIFCAPGA